MPARILLTHATGLGPLPDLLEARGGSKAVARAFASHDVPMALVTERMHRMPLAAMIGLFDGAARLAGDARFGLHVGHAMEPGAYGRWVVFAMQAQTLAGALSRLARCIVLHQVGGTVVLQSRPGGRVIWEYRQTAVAGAEAMQHTDHVIPVMLRVLRAYCGPEWTPCWIETSTADPGDGTAREDTLAAPWRFAGAANGIVFPAAALWARRRAPSGDDTPSPITTAEVLAEIRHRRAERDIDRLSAIVALRLLDGRTDLEGAARMAGVGPRTLQRQLDGAGVSYRALLGDIRMDRARALIHETDAPLSDIADLVGYSDPAHFTRAFRSRFGVPPSAYRRQNDRG
jgi:AraC-like DNA-binding protein